MSRSEAEKKKMILDHSFIPHIKFNLQWTIDLIVKAKMIKLLEENRIILHDIEVAKISEDTRITDHEIKNL